MARSQLNHILSEMYLKWGRKTGALITIFIFFSVSISFIGYLYYSSQVDAIKLQKQSELISITKLKINQILRWKYERWGDANIVLNNVPLIGKINDWFNRRNSEKAKNEILIWEKTLKASYDYYSIIYLDKSLNRHKLNKDDQDYDLTAALHLGARAVKSKSIVFSDIYRQGRGEIRIDIVVPLFLKKNNDTTNAGVIILQIDPAQYLFDLILTWPTESRTSETLIVRKERDSVLFLNNLRFNKDAALKLKISLNETEVPAVQAVLGYEGIYEGKDYRGNKVLTDISKIPGTTWSMVTKIDQDEIYQPITEKAVQIALFTGILILFAAFGVYTVYKNQKLENINRLKSAEIQQLALAKHFEYLVKYANDIIILGDENLKIIEVNDSALKQYGYSKDELLNMSFGQLRIPEEQELLIYQIKQVETFDRHLYETIHQRKDGTKFPIEVNLHVINIEGKKYYQGIIRDITERKSALRALEHSEKHFRSLFENMLNGYAYCRMIFDGQNTPLDFIYIDVNRSFEKLTGLKNVAGKKVSEVIPGIRQSDPGLFEIYGRVALTGKPEIFEINVKLMNMWFSISVYSPAYEFFVAVFDVITERKNAEIALKASEALYHSLVENIPASIFRKNKEGRYEFVNFKFCLLKGLSENEILGKTPNELSEYEKSKDAKDGFSIISEDRQKTLIQGTDHHNLIMATGKQIELEELYTMADGTIKYFQVIKAPIIAHNKSIIGSQGIQFDITERKNAEELLRKSEHRLRRFYDSGLIGVIFWNLAGGITDANDKFLEMTGYTREELNEGKIDWVNMTPEEFKPLDEVSLVELKEYGFNKVPFEKEYTRKDGSRIPILITGAMLDEERNNGIAIVVDITKQKIAQKEIEKLNAELEDRITQRTSQLEASNKELEAFSYSVSHDLRAPLRALDGFAKILLEEYNDKLDTEGKRLFSIIIANTKKMGQLIDDLLAFSRLSRQGLNRTQIDMKELVNEVFNELIMIDAKIEIEYNVRHIPPVYGDHSMMRQVWRNLISNAIKFSSKMGKSIIEIGSYEEEQKTVYFIKDNGVGFNMLYADKLFGVFQRLHTDTEFEGTGVGLAIVQRIINRHGGKIWAESRENKGAEFYFYLNKERSLV